MSLVCIFLVVVEEEDADPMSPNAGAERAPRAGADRALVAGTDGVPMVGANGAPRAGVDAERDATTVLDMAESAVESRDIGRGCCWARRHRGGRGVAQRGGPGVGGGGTRESH